MSYEYSRTTKTTSSSGGGRYEDEDESKRTKRYSSGGTQPIMQTRGQTVIQRSMGGPSIGMGRGRTSMTFRKSMNFPTYSQEGLEKMTQEGVSQMKGVREKEKHDMQDLNTRFASYIEKVRFLEAQIQNLNAQVANLKARQTDFTPIEEKYKAELAQARNIIRDLTEQKAATDAREITSQDELEHQKLMCSQAEKDKNDYRNKCEKLNNQLADFDSELSALRRKVDLAETDLQKARDTNQRLRDELNKNRKDLDVATEAQILEAAKAMEIEETLGFENSVLRSEIDEMKSILDALQEQNPREKWEQHMSSAVREIQKEYDNQLDRIRDDYELRIDSQLRTMAAAPQKNNMEAQIAKEENKKIKTQMQSNKNQMANLQAKNDLLETQLRDMQTELEELLRKLEDEEMKHSDERSSQCMMIEELRKLLDDATSDKQSLEMEIQIYRKLLECEENHISESVRDSHNIRSQGGDALSNIIQQSSIGGSGGGGFIEKQSEETRGLKISRSARGAVIFEDCKAEGVQIKNTNRRTGKSQNLRGWKIVGKSAGQADKVYTFKDIDINGDEKITVFGRRFKDKIREDSKDVYMDDLDWFQGQSSYQLLDPEGTEKATVTHSFTR